MDIERKKKEKRIQLVGGLIGICVVAVALFYFFYAEKALLFTASGYRLIGKNTTLIEPTLIRRESTRA